MVGEKKVSSKLLDTETFPEKIYRVNDHIVCGVAGITSDANTLLDYARQYALSYTYSYGEPIPVEQLVQKLCDLKQSYTQYGGLRPFGVGFLYAGWDKHEGFQLYSSDPSGNYGRWKATCIGAKSQTAQSSLKQDYAESMSLKDASSLALRVFLKTMEKSSLSGDRIELVSVERDEKGCVFSKFFSAQQIDILIKELQILAQPE